MSTKGWSYARALATRNLDVIRHAAAELPRVPLADAAVILPLLADAEPGRYDRAACRWLARYCPERDDVTLEAVDEALGALQRMAEAPAESLIVLRDLTRLGHADASFTLRVYVHVLSDDLGAPLDLASELGAADTCADTGAF